MSDGQDEITLPKRAVPREYVSWFDSRGAASSSPQAGRDAAVDEAARWERLSAPRVTWRTTSATWWTVWSTSVRAT